LNLFKFKVKI